jgi:hypothetical protein
MAENLVDMLRDDFFVDASTSHLHAAVAFTMRRGGGGA